MDEAVNSLIHGPSLIEHVPTECFYVLDSRNMVISVTCVVF